VFVNDGDSVSSDKLLKSKRVRGFNLLVASVCFAEEAEGGDTPSHDK